MLPELELSTSVPTVNTSPRSANGLAGFTISRLLVPRSTTTLITSVDNPLDCTRTSKVMISPALAMILVGLSIMFGLVATEELPMMILFEDSLTRSVPLSEKVPSALMPA